MKLTTAIVVLGLTTGAAWCQAGNVIQNTKTALNAVQQKKTAESNAALQASQGQSSKPSAGSGMTVKPAAVPAATAKAPAQPAKPMTAANKPASKAASPAVSKAPAKTTAQAQPKAVSKPAKTAVKAQPKTAVSVQSAKAPEPKKEEEKSKPINLTGRRDPFISPVINQSAVGSGCSTGKRCLAVEQISLKGVVKAESGMIAVVVNALDKAYFLRENDPVFNGYVVKITGDSIVFKETVQDKLGKSFTREVTKKITTPAV